MIGSSSIAAFPVLIVVDEAAHCADRSDDHWGDDNPGSMFWDMPREVSPQERRPVEDKILSKTRLGEEEGELTSKPRERRSR
jgi:hypothetical protein